MDYSKYHPDWKDIIRPAVLKRDQYKCRQCDVKHKSRVYKNSRGKYVECDSFVERWAINQGKKVFTLYLQVAHLDNNKENNNLINLLSLCPKCHGKYDKEYKKFMRLLTTEKSNISKSFRLSGVSPEQTARYSALREFINDHTSVMLESKQLNKIVEISKQILDYEYSK